MAHQLHCNAIEPSKRSHTPPLDASTGSTSPPLPVLRRHPTCRTRDRQLRSTSETSRRLSTHTGKSPDSPGGGTRRDPLSDVTSQVLQRSLRNRERLVLRTRS